MKEERKKEKEWERLTERKQEGRYIKKGVRREGDGERGRRRVGGKKRKKEERGIVLDR